MNPSSKENLFRIKEISQLSDKTAELIKENEIEEAYHNLYRLNSIMKSADLTDSERVIILYTQAIYFNYYNQIEKVESCCKEIIKLSPYSEDSFIYFSLACLLFSKLIYYKNNYIKALKIAKTGFKYLQLCRDSDSSFELLKNYKEFVDFIEKNNENSELLNKPQKPLKARPRFSSVPYKKPLLTPIIHKKPKKLDQIPTRLSFFPQKTPNTLYSLPTHPKPKSEKRNYFNKSVQHHRAPSEPATAQSISDILKLFISKQRIFALKVSKSSIIKALKLLETLKSESNHSKPASTRLPSLSLPTIPEIS